ncbi:MAG: low molecular weight phosphotyrosine protein phosphatase [Clostridia bacterium]|nr:low molecular weight phosphotyrosine protein phosphatase [Clostridia bacterium]MBQ7038606.1 low molecular weight phosphotyrosine protein phosphatase [Clostridia bacterium]
MKKVLFLCHGNICRSPMAEFIFKDLAKGEDLYAESTAVSREEIGNPIYPKAADTLRRHAIPFGGHRARQITTEDYDRFDYIVVMEEYNIPRLMRIIGDDPDKKVYRLLDFTDTPGDIEDPWYSGRFEAVFNQIHDGCKALLKHIKNTEE